MIGIPDIETMDRAYQSAGYADLVMNTVEAMGKMANTGFDEALQGLDHVKELTEALRRGDAKRLTRAAGQGDAKPDDKPKTKRKK